MKGKRVLLVDDEVDFTSSLAKVLSRRGFEVKTAADGLEALAHIAKEPFDVIVLDVKMPGMDGIQVLTEIRRLALDTRVILLTGHLSLTDEENGLKGGAFAYLFKPFPILKLVSLIDSAASGDKARPLEHFSWISLESSNPFRYYKLMPDTSPNIPADQKQPWLNQMIHRPWKGLLLFLEVIGLSHRSEVIDQEAQVARLKLNHAEFRKLLSANNSFLETMTELEHKLLNKELVDLTYIKRRVLRAIADIHTMVETLIVISNGRYLVLRETLEEVVSALTKIVEDSNKAAPLTWVKDLPAVNRSQADLAGGKMANLGEIRNVLDLPTPEGFVVTTEGYRLLLEKGGLRSWIQDKDLELLSTEDVEKASQVIQDQILKVEIPSSLIGAIQGAYDRLTAGIGMDGPLAIRSSALGEDSDFSFAGQFLSLLNIGPEKMVEAYLRVVASLYSPEAIHYRLLHGIPGQSAEMAVGFLSLVDALVSGVTFSKDPNRPDSGQILIQAVRGLGVPLVEGRTSPEVISISRDLNKDRIRRTLSQQKARLFLSSEKGITEEPISPDEAGEPCLTDEEAIQLGRWALLLEDHFGSPQDIEWAMDRNRKLILLQSRPLRLLGHKAQDSQPLPGYPLLLSEGETACPGAGTGPAIHMTENDDLNSFPVGGILIARRSSPRFIRLMNKAQAIVTDFGSTTGHMASLAREFRVPALLNTKLATQKIPPGTIVTVDATNGLVYQGEVPLPAWDNISRCPARRIGRTKTRSSGTPDSPKGRPVHPALKPDRSPVQFL